MARPGRRELVLDTAMQQFSRKGYHATTVRDIAEESGMLSGSLYAHFAGKEEILFEIVLRSAYQFMSGLEPIARGPGCAETKLKAAMAAHLRVVAESPERTAVFLHEWKALSPDRRAVIAGKRREYEALWASIIREGVCAGQFRPVDEKFARLLILGAVNWVHEWYRPDGPLTLEEVAERFADLVLGGLRRQGGGTE